MDEQTVHDVLSGRRRGMLAPLTRGVLACGAVVYGGVVTARNAAFDLGWRSVRRLPVPVISVGNLTTGGTGKTPLVAWLVGELRRRGFRPGVLSRGYRGLSGGENDEARVLARLCPGVPQVQQRCRYAGGQHLLDSSAGRSVNVLVLDDGFQHRQLHRDLDVVLIDAVQPWGYGRLLPRGLLREPLSALRRADVVLLTRVDLVAPDVLADVRHTVERVRGRGVEGEVMFAPVRLVNPRGDVLPLNHLQAERWAAFCGIGNPRGFVTLLQRHGVNVPCRVFPDHHHYTADDWARLEAWRESVGATGLLTTLKDLVKVPAELSHVWAVDLAVVWRRGAEQVLERVGQGLVAALRSAA